MHSSDEHSSGPNILEQDRGRTSGTKPVCFTQGLETRASVNTQLHADEAAEANVQHTTAMSTVSACDSRCVRALSISTSKQYSPVVKKFVNRTCNREAVFTTRLRGSDSTEMCASQIPYKRITENNTPESRNHKSAAAQPRSRSETRRGGDRNRRGR